MSKHTPGPWDAWIRKSKFGITGPAAADCMNAIIAFKDDPYCVGGSAIQIASESREAPAIAFGDNKETAEANARLIAAAPDMLEALKQCKQALDALHQPGDSIYTRAADAADRAIDKAIGTADE